MVIENETMNSWIHALSFSLFFLLCCLLADVYEGVHEYVSAGQAQVDA